MTLLASLSHYVPSWCARYVHVATNTDLPKVYVYKLEELADGDLLYNHWHALNDDDLSSQQLTVDRAYGSVSANAHRH